MSQNILASGHAYDPYFYANEAILQLEAALGMAGRVHRGYSPTAQHKGSTIDIRTPDSFTAQDAPSAAQDLNPTYTNIRLDQWKEVKFKLTDKELSLSSENVINDHIRPAAYALASDIDTALNALYADIPWFVDLSGTPAVADITGVRKVLFDNKAPIKDAPNMHLELDGAAEMGFLNLSAFSQQQGAADAGVTTQREGDLGRKFGFNTFSNQNVATHTKGTCNDTALAVNNGAGYAAGATTVALDAVDAGVTGTLVKGDVIKFAGHSQQYVVTALSTASGNAFAAVQIFPALKAAVVDDEAVTAYLDNHTANLAFHRNAFALATAPLSDMGNELGAKVASVADPITGLSLRSRVFYVGDTSSVYVAFDVLYGVKTLDPNKGARLRG